MREQDHDLRVPAQAHCNRHYPESYERPPYDRPLRFPKYNGPISVRHDHRIFRRLPEFASWRKPDHYLAALASAYACQETDRRYCEAIHAALAQYGDGNGVLISGIVRDHFPETVKDRLRLLAGYAGLMADVSYSHWRASGRRRETWQKVRAEVQS